MSDDDEMLQPDAPPWVDHFFEEFERIRERCTEVALALDMELDALVIAGADGKVRRWVRLWVSREIDRLLTGYELAEIESGLIFQDDDEDA